MEEKRFILISIRLHSQKPSHLLTGKGGGGSGTIPRIIQVCGSFQAHCAATGGTAAMPPVAAVQFAYCLLDAVPGEGSGVVNRGYEGGIRDDVVIREGLKWGGGLML